MPSDDLVGFYIYEVVSNAATANISDIFIFTVYWKCFKITIKESGLESETE